MFRKSALVFRALVATFFVGSLVACTFEGTMEDPRGRTTSNVERGDDGPAENVVAHVHDGGSHDASFPVDAGGYDGSASADGGWNGDSDGGWSGDSDGGSSDSDGGWGDNDGADAGAW
jgi:hypothetical protein